MTLPVTDNGTRLIERPARLSREWATTRQIAAGVPCSPTRARKLLLRLEAAGLVERTLRGDSHELWRRAR